MKVCLYDQQEPFTNHNPETMQLPNAIMAMASGGILFEWHDYFVYTGQEGENVHEDVTHLSVLSPNRKLELICNWWIEESLEYTYN